MNYSGSGSTPLSAGAAPKPYWTANQTTNTALATLQAAIVPVAADPTGLIRRTDANALLLIPFGSTTDAQTFSLLVTLWYRDVTNAIWVPETYTLTVTIGALDASAAAIATLYTTNVKMARNATVSSPIGVTAPDISIIGDATALATAVCKIRLWLHGCDGYTIGGTRGSSAVTFNTLHGTE